MDEGNIWQRYPDTPGYPGCLENERLSFADAVTALLAYERACRDCEGYDHGMDGHATVMLSIGFEITPNGQDFVQIWAN